MSGTSNSAPQIDISTVREEVKDGGMMMELVLSPATKPTPKSAKSLSPSITAQAIKEKLTAAEERRLSMDSLRLKGIQTQHAKIEMANQKKEEMVAEKSSKVKEEVENKLKTAEEKRTALLEEKREKVKLEDEKIKKAQKEQEETEAKESAKVEAELSLKLQKAAELKEKQDKALQEKLAEKTRKADLVRENKKKLGLEGSQTTESA